MNLLSESITCMKTILITHSRVFHALNHSAELSRSFVINFSGVKINFFLLIRVMRIIHPRSNDNIPLNCMAEVYHLKWKEVSVMGWRKSLRVKTLGFV